MEAKKKALDDLRRDADLTQLQVALALATAPSRVADWERGRAMPSAKYMRPLARALGVTVEQVLDAAEESVRIARSSRTPPK